MFKYGNSGFVKREFSKHSSLLKEEIDKISKTKMYQNPRGFVNLPADSKYVNRVKAVIREKQKLNPSLVVVIGIGGSNLGAQAVVKAVFGKKQINLNPKILFADTVDPDDLKPCLGIAEKILKADKNIILNVISKSGTTTETIANFEIFLDLLSKYKIPTPYVVVTSDKDSKLWAYGKKHRFSLLEVPKNVGGRFSVFSAVGLFPLGMLGIDLDDFLLGAKDMVKNCLNKSLLDNPAAVNAFVIYQNFLNNKIIYDTFLFSKDLEYLGKWYRQLLGESIGKNSKVGITPTVSIGTIDLHSVAQLYLAGPDDKLTNFVKTRFNAEISLPKIKEFDKLVKNIQGIKLSKIMDAVYKGTILAFKKHKRSFTETVLPDKTPYSIAAFMQWKMIEIVLLARLLNVNAFNQPNVESYKKETRKLLRK